MKYSSHKIYRLYLELLKKHGDPRQYWPTWCARKKSRALREEIAMGAILTQRTNWRQVETALTNLRQHDLLSIKGIYDLQLRSAEVARQQFLSKSNRSLKEEKLYRTNSLWDFEKIGQAPRASYLESLAQLIRSTGFYRQKARRLWEFCRLIIEEYGSLEKFRKLEVGEAREKLLSLWGIGPETADSILLYALGKPNFVIDEYTKRLLRRKKLLKNYDYNYMKAFFEQNLPQNTSLYQDFHALIVVEEKGEKAARMIR